MKLDFELHHKWTCDSEDYTYWPQYIPFIEDVSLTLNILNDQTVLNIDTLRSYFFLYTSLTQYIQHIKGEYSEEKTLNSQTKVNIITII